MAAPGDPLLLLRQAIASSTPPIPTLTESADTSTEDYGLAKYLTFSAPAATSIPLSVATRFILSEEPVDLRSVFFAWQHKDDPIPDYIASAQALNDQLAAAASAGDEGASKVRNLVFVERLDLITWLEGSSDDSEYIKPLDSDAAAAAAAAAGVSARAVGQAGVGIDGVAAAAGVIPGGRPISPRLREIYNNERRMSDRHTVLRGIKPTDFSHVRKLAENYLRSARKAGAAPSGGAGGIPSNPSSAPNQSSTTLVSRPNSSSSSSAPSSSSNKPSRRLEPIILISPSASALLRMSNVKSFLSDGTYTPPDNSLAAATTSILHISRLLPSVDRNRPQRFILVDSPEQFKPDYWARVVAVFTTGQSWQFKSYKWQTPQELFSHVLGIYVGWRGDQVPETVRGWGRSVVSVGVEKWRGEGVERWRDREVVEGLWDKIEDRMRSAGWGAGGPRLV